jgi:cytochrome c-type biogenesis protein CcmH/NrfF
MTRRAVGYAAMLVVLAVTLVIGIRRADAPRTDQQRIDAIAKSLKCPVCTSESIYESRAPISLAIKEDIARDVHAGQSATQIKAQLATEFGESSLLLPPRSGIAGLVWTLPAVALVLAVAGLVIAFRRWRALALASAATDADRELVEAARRRPDEP